MRPCLTLLIVILLISCTAASPPEPTDPTFDCYREGLSSIEELVCADEGLAPLDRQLAEVYAAARAKEVDEHPPFLKSEQRGWIKGRDDCWKADDRHACVTGSYQRRIVELQAQYRLVPFSGPFFYTCDGNPSNEIVVTLFNTDPPTLIAERGDSVSLMVLEPSGSGSRYRGRNELFWDKGGEATVTWGYGAHPMRCVLPAAGR